MRLATKAGSAAPSAVRWPSPQVTGGLPPRVIRQDAAERGAQGGSHLPIRGSKQVLIEQISVDAHVVHELGHVSELLGENRDGGGVFNADDRGAHLVAGSHRLPPRKLHPALWWAKQTRRALDVAVCRTSLGGPEGGKGGIQGPKKLLEHEGSDTHWPVVDEPFITWTRWCLASGRGPHSR